MYALLCFQTQFRLPPTPFHPFPMTPEDPYARKLKEAAFAVKSGTSYTSACVRYDVPRSSLHKVVKARSNWNIQADVPHRCGRPPALSKEEEELLVGLLVQHSSKGTPLTDKHLEEAVRSLVLTMPPVRREHLPFRGGTPGRKWKRGFRARHRQVISFGRPCRQEAERFKACNAETLTTHFAVLDKLIRDHNLDASNIYNLDEVGATPGKDVAGRSSRKQYTSRKSRVDARAPRFANIPRVTMMPLIAADGSAHIPLLVFKGSRIPFREFVVNGVKKLDSYQERLPRGALVTVRENIGGVDTTNFYSWALQFVHLVKSSHGMNRKVLLIYDGYRSHMSLRVLELFSSNNIIAYALPSHTSGKTQPCDTVLFGAFKQALNQVISELMAPDRDDVWTMYEFCSMMKTAYENSFTPSNIRSSFRRAGICPTDPTRLLSVPRPASAECPNEVKTVMQMEAMMKEKNCQFRSRILGSGAQIGSSGWIDTRNGSVLTSAHAMQLMRQRSGEVDRKRRVAEAKAQMISDKHAAVRLTASKFREAIWTRRAASFRLDVATFKSMVRPLYVRRAHARRKAAEAARSNTMGRV